ncbi:MAG: adenylosuccinate lyase, partial [Microgenomates bacterium 39_7]
KPIFSLSVVDGRYSSKTAPLAKIFSEAALISNRITVEVKYLLLLAKHGVTRPISAKEKKLLLSFCEPSLEQLKKVKLIESKIHHDVKAIEYFLRESFQNTSLEDLSPSLHFGITSEDINNLAYRLMISRSIKQVLVPQLAQLLTSLTKLAEKNADQPMLARTHGQLAIPTTFGKEVAVYVARLIPLINQISKQNFSGKFNGAIGGYQALAMAYPEKNWLAISQEFVESFGLKFLPLSTQINPQDDLVDLFQKLQHLNLILIGLNQDIWRYISNDWLVQTVTKDNVGSSTMPQKVNPIDFENSEGNLKMANGLLLVFINSFPISRLQRDLSDSTIQRNIGTSFAHCLLAYQALTKGLAKIKVNKEKMEEDLLANWNVLAEAAQTMARKNGDQTAYEKIASLVKNKTMNKKDWQKMVKEIDEKLLDLNPQNYLGLSVSLTKDTVKKSYQLLKEIQS